MSKRDLVVKINETAFTSIELIKKTKEKIIKEYFTVNEFFKKADKIDKNLEVLINNLVTKTIFWTIINSLKIKKTSYFLL